MTDRLLLLQSFRISRSIYEMKRPPRSRVHTIPMTEVDVQKAKDC